MPRVRYSAAISQMSGSAGDQVFVPGPNGPVVRQTPKFRRIMSPAQKAASDRLRNARDVWQTLDYPQAQAWEAYGATQWRTDPVTGVTHGRNGYNAFCALTSKLLQYDPAATVPLLPPEDAFTGDALVVGVTGGVGKLVFSASAPNSPQVVTELLIERLPNARRKASGRYASAGFSAFADGTLSFDAALAAGWYVAAYRFVCAATGQMTLPRNIGRVQAL